MLIFCPQVFLWTNQADYIMHCTFASQVHSCTASIQHSEGYRLKSLYLMELWLLETYNLKILVSKVLLDSNLIVFWDCLKSMWGQESRTEKWMFSFTQFSTWLLTLSATHLCCCNLLIIPCTYLVMNTLHICREPFNQQWMTSQAPANTSSTPQKIAPAITSSTPKNYTGIRTKGLKHHNAQIYTPENF